MIEEKEPDYSLMPLRQVLEYVKEHDVPCVHIMIERIVLELERITESLKLEDLGK